MKKKLILILLTFTIAILTAACADETSGTYLEEGTLIIKIQNADISMNELEITSPTVTEDKISISGNNIIVNTPMYKTSIQIESSQYKTALVTVFSKDFVNKLCEKEITLERRKISIEYSIMRYGSEPVTFSDDVTVLSNKGSTYYLETLATNSDISFTVSAGSNYKATTITIDKDDIKNDKYKGFAVLPRQNTFVVYFHNASNINHNDENNIVKNVYKYRITDEESIHAFEIDESMTNEQSFTIDASKYGSSDITYRLTSKSYYTASDFKDGSNNWINGKTIQLDFEIGEHIFIKVPSDLTYQNISLINKKGMDEGYLQEYDNKYYLEFVYYPSEQYYIVIQSNGYLYSTSNIDFSKAYYQQIKTYDYYERKKVLDINTSQIKQSYHKVTIDLSIYGEAYKNVPANDFIITYEGAQAGRIINSDGQGKYVILFDYSVFDSIKFNSYYANNFYIVINSSGVPYFNNSFYLFKNIAE